MVQRFLFGSFYLVKYNFLLEFKVDDKYQYSCENKDLKVHGWISQESETNPAMGFWVIIPSNEFRSGGLVKQNLTSHVGPISLAVSILLRKM